MRRENYLTLVEARRRRPDPLLYWVWWSTTGLAFGFAGAAAVFGQFWTAGGFTVAGLMMVSVGRRVVPK